MPNPIAFIPGGSPETSGPFGRFLPLIPAGAITAWLERSAAPGDWILEPFGASPAAVIEAARAGYRVLVAANNPVARFLLELATDPPTEADLRASLAALAASTKGDQRLEPHIRSLYLTLCAQCGREIEAQAFLWERDAPTPFGRLYSCPHCGDSGEHAATQEDAQRASQYSSKGLHWSRALERVALVNDPDRAHAEEALDAYLPRAVYALFTLINKLDQMAPSPAALGPRSDWEDRQRHLEALVLSACDQANNLWPYPQARARPRQLTTPTRFREKNVWLALEDAVKQWTFPGSENSKPVPLCIWPDQPPASGGICLYEGRLKTLSESLGEVNIRAVLAALPRPNQAYWTLSALWAGWLWGRDSAAAFKSVLRRRRYDWAWHTTALHTALSSLTVQLKPGTRIWAITGEAEPSLISSAAISAHLAGLSMQNISLRDESDEVQISWETAAQANQEPRTDELEQPINLSQLQLVGTQGAQKLLEQRGEPSRYIQLHSAALQAILAAPKSVPFASLAPADAYSQLHGTLQKLFNYQNGFLRYGGSDHSPETGYFWLREAQNCAAPLADRLEIKIVQLLQSQPGVHEADVDQAICVEFPGLETPERSAVHACLESYGEQEPPESGHWIMRDQDSPPVRRDDLAMMQKLILQLGERAGYRIAGESEPAPMGQFILEWQDPSGAVRFAFYVIASALLSKVLIRRLPVEHQAIIVCPGGRSGLIDYKRKTNPHLNYQLENHWSFVKFRHVRRLAENSQVDPTMFLDQLLLDPLSNQDPQMQLL
jgi:hypothetical protein